MDQMDKFLAEMYGTNKTASAASNAEDFEKQAEVELFMKLASEQKIDLQSMSDEKVAELFTLWQAETVKVAGEEGKDDKDEKKKKLEEAEKEHGEKKAASEKIAEADMLGRVMAHAYVQELRKIASAEAPAPSKTAGEMPPAFRAAMEAKKGKEGKEEGKEGKEEKEEKKDEKKASAIDQLAVEHAIILAKNAGVDPEEAGRKVAAVVTLSLVKESQKTASAPNVNAAIEIRALEFLEAAGYPVTWTDAQ